MEYQIIEKVGEGQLVKPNQQLRVRVTTDQGKPLICDVSLGANHIDPSIEQILLQMGVGFKYTIRNKEHTKVIQIMSAGAIVEHKSGFQIAQEQKQNGNTLMKDKKYAQAIECYAKAHRAIQHMYSEKQQLLKLTIIGNMAMACINAGQFTQAVQWCQMHLNQTLEPNQKILYRQATAQKGLRNWEQARKIIQTGINTFSADANAVQLFKQLQVTVEKEYHQQLQKQKQVYSKMFS